jgi:hypothetical protein
VDKKTPNQQINFKPVTDGLGFHPFSDGLPYAPIGKTYQPKYTRSEGAGAIAAGSPSFVFPGDTSALRSSLKKTTSPVGDSTARLEMAPAFGIIYLSKRALAYLFDSGLNISLCAGALSAALIKYGFGPEALFAPGVAFFSFLFLLTFNWAIITAQEVAFGTTVGKRLFGLALSGSGSAVFLRAFFFVPSLGFCGLGLLWGLLNQKKRCWHDVVVDLQPIEIAEL